MVIETASEHRIFYFEPGEMMILLEPKSDSLDPDVSISDDDLLALRQVHGLPLRDANPCDGRTQIIVNRGGVKRVIQTLTLDSWVEDLIEADPELVKTAVKQVTDWVRIFNEKIFPQRQRDIELLTPRDENAELTPEQLAQIIGTLKATAREPLDLPNYRVIAAAPNWLSVSACFGCGGPSGPPDAPLAVKRFNVPNIRTDVDSRAGAGADTNRVRVAVFDTWPLKPGDPEHPLKKISEARSYRFPSNMRMKDFADGKVVPEARIHLGTKSVKAGVTTITPYLKPEWENIKVARRNQAGTFEIPYDESDHGLFVTDLLADALGGLVDIPNPNVDISVYRVLNDTGSGRAEGVARAIEDAIIDAETNNINFLVLNLSLGFGPPVIIIPTVLTDPTKPFNSVAWGLWVKAQLALPRKPFDETVMLTEPAFDLLRWVLAVRTHSTPGKQVIAVAAAGNDAAPNTHVAPRIPAFMEEVFGVSSMRSVVGAAGSPNVNSANISTFSNDNDSFPPLDGVAARGEGLVGLFTGDQKWNTTGWATWDGTSFATPIVVALATRLAARGKGLVDVQNLLFNKTTVTPPPTLDKRPVVPFDQ